MLKSPSDAMTAIVFRGLELLRRKERSSRGARVTTRDAKQQARALYRFRGVFAPDLFKPELFRARHPLPQDCVTALQAGGFERATFYDGCTGTAVTAHLDHWIAKKRAVMTDCPCHEATLSLMYSCLLGPFGLSGLQAWSLP